MHSAQPARVLRSVAIWFANRSAPIVSEPFEKVGITLVRADSLKALFDSATSADLSAAVIEFDATVPDEHFFLIEALRRRLPKLPIVIGVPAGNNELRLRSARCGATDVLASPMRAEVLLGALLRRLFPERTAAARSSRSSLGPLIGSSEAMQLLYDAILRVAASNTTVLIRGESGSGKELVARTIVALSSRRDKPFIRLNCAALPESLMESELFGSERGAYTGAVTSRAGHIEMAQGGTLFLDEIATLPISLQTKLLRVIEDRSVQRLGSNTSKTIDFRLLTATNEDLEQMVKQGKFREDLYYRIHVIPISVPPLRQRRGDIALLAKHFIHVYCAANGMPPKQLELEALEVLEDNPWPGNIRELENLIQRLVLMVQGPSISVNDLPEQVLYESASRHESLLIPDGGIDFDKEMERIEVAYLRAALKRSGGKKVGAAALLNINEQRMKYLCRKYNLGVGDNSGKHEALHDDSGEKITDGPIGDQNLTPER